MENEQKMLAGYEEAYEFLDAKSIHEMRQLARAFGVAKPSLYKKHDLLVRVIGLVSGALPPEQKSNKGAKVKGGEASAESVEKVREVILQCKARLPYKTAAPRPKEYEFNDSGETSRQNYASGEKCAEGIVELDEQGGGRLRGTGCEAGENDAWFSESLIRTYHLREGDLVNCCVENREGLPQVVRVLEMEGLPPVYAERKKFDSLAAAYPDEQIVFAQEREAALRAIDTFCPIGYGQRVLLVAPRGTGVTTFLRTAAETARRGGARTVFVLLGQRPEEIAETRRDFSDGCVAATGFDEPAVRGAYMALLALERAERFAERGEKTVLLLDSLAALLQAMRGAAPFSEENQKEEWARLRAKSFFARARRLESAGSLTIIAASGALTEEQTEDFSSAANAVLYFSARLAERGLFPPVDFLRSRSKRPEVFSSADASALAEAREALAETDDPADFLRRFADETRKTDAKKL